MDSQLIFRIKSTAAYYSDSSDESVLSFRHGQEFFVIGTNEDEFYLVTTNKSLPFARGSVTGKVPMSYFAFSYGQILQKIYEIMSTLLNGLLVNSPRYRDNVCEVGKIIYISIDCVPDGLGVFSKCVRELSLSSDEEKNGLCVGFVNAAEPAGQDDGGDGMKRVLNGFSSGYRRRGLAQG
jgi:hypothetical protein